MQYLVYRPIRTNPRYLAVWFTLMLWFAGIWGGPQTTEHPESAVAAELTVEELESLQLEPLINQDN